MWSSIAFHQYMLVPQVEQDRRMLRAWRDYARQRRLKKASSPPTITSGRSMDVQCSASPTLRSNGMGAALAMVVDEPQDIALSVPTGLHCKGSEAAVGTNVPIVALKAICT